MTDERTPGTTDDAANREQQGPIAKVISKVIGSPDGDKTDPGGPRGWEMPADEQQMEPENEPSPSAD